MANQCYEDVIPRLQEGRFAIVTKRGAREAMDALASGELFSPDENAGAYGQAVWFWRRDAGAKSFRKFLPQGDGGKQARSPGSNCVDVDR